VDEGHERILAVYLGFLVVGTAMAVLGRRGGGPPPTDGGVWRKYPSYVALNALFLVAAWLPQSWPVFPLGLAGLGVLAEREIYRALCRVPGGLQSVAVVALCAGYVPICLVAFLRVWQADPTGHRAAFLYLVVAVHDAFAQVVGEALGRRSLAPAISPAKTIEGVLGGLAAAAAMGVALAPAVGWSAGLGGGLGLACGVAALGGDLLASALKRAAGLRTFGDLLGPHGGVMDRVDGLLPAAATLWALVAAVGLQR